MKKLLMTLFFMTALLQAQELSHVPGVFLDIGFGARPTAMGGAFSAVADDAHATLWNPAGLALVEKRHATFFHTWQLGIIPYTMAAYAHNRGKSNWNHGEALIVSGDDALRETTVYMAAAYDASRYLENLNVGVALKYKNAAFGRNQDGSPGKITGNAIGFGLDVGFGYSFSNLRTSLVLKDLIDAVWWNSSSMGSYRQNNPLRVVMGMGYLVSGHTVLSVDLEKSLHVDTSDKLAIGLEKSMFEMISLRGGAFQNLEPSAFTNYSLGGGFYYAASGIGIHFDFAYLIQELENSQRISLSLEF